MLQGARLTRPAMGDRRMCWERVSAAPGAAGWLGLAAAPTFGLLVLQRLAAGLSAELPQVQREALLLPSPDDEASLFN